MNNFRTQITTLRPDFFLSHQTKLMLFGSCFAENIGSELIRNKFDVNVNPFGIQYNPLSITEGIDRLLMTKRFTEEELDYNNHQYHSFMHHGDFSHSDVKLCLDKINTVYNQATFDILKTDVFLITFGTAYVYKLKENNQVVTNCHKFPSTHFTRTLLTIDEVFKSWTGTIDKILSRKPDCKFIFTVSPIRHLRDGAHDNQISKSILHIAISYLMKRYPSSVYYFPAYEIMIDDLRDYRFYADDMLHPSKLAIEYIWMKIKEMYFNSSTINILSEWNELNKALNHKPINTDSPQYLRFLDQTLTKIVDFQNKFPFIHLSGEIEDLKQKIEQ